MNNLEIFAKRLKERRTELKMKQSELAKSAQTSAQTISSYEQADGTKRKNPTLANAIEIAKKLNVSLDWLCGLADSNSKSDDFAFEWLRYLVNLLSNPPMVISHSSVEAPWHFPDRKAITWYVHKPADETDESSVRIVLNDEVMEKFFDGIQAVNKLQDSKIEPQLYNTLIDAVVKQYKEYFVPEADWGKITGEKGLDGLDF